MGQVFLLINTFHVPTIYSVNKIIITELKIRCSPPNSTAQTSQMTITEDTVGDSHVSNSNTMSTIEREEENNTGIYEELINKLFSICLLFFYLRSR